MNKKSLFLFSISSLLLSSCISLGGGASLKEITPEEATEIINNVRTTAQELTKPYHFEYKQTDEYLRNEQTQIDESHYVFAINKEEEFYYSWIYKTNNQKTGEGISMTKKHKTYEKVSYLKEIEYNDPGDEDDNVEVIATRLEGNPIYDFQTEFYISSDLDSIESIQLFLEAFVMCEYLTPETVQETIDAYSDRGYTVTPTYKADSKGNMTITVVTESTDPTATTGLKKAVETISYKKYKFTEFTSTNEQFSGTKNVYTAKMKYENSVFSLPSEWEKSLMEPGLTSFPSSQLTSFLSENNVTEEIPELPYSGAAYDCFINEYVFGDHFCVRVHTDDVDAAFIALCSLIPSEWIANEESYDSELHVKSYRFTSPLEQIEIVIEKCGTYVYIAYEASNL